MINWVKKTKIVVVKLDSSFLTFHSQSELAILYSTWILFRIIPLLNFVPFTFDIWLRWHNDLLFLWPLHLRNSATNWPISVTLFSIVVLFCFLLSATEKLLIFLKFGFAILICFWSIFRQSCSIMLIML